jgi:hypothetical protein
MCGGYSGEYDESPESDIWDKEPWLNILSGTVIYIHIPPLEKSITEELEVSDD